jgi:hypothetical protein
MTQYTIPNSSYRSAVYFITTYCPFHRAQHVADVGVDKEIACFTGRICYVLFVLIVQRDYSVNTERSGKYSGRADESEKSWKK